MRVIPCNFFGAKWNMAADEYLMQYSKIPVLRFYQWSTPTLSFGRSQAIFSDLDFSVIAKFDIQGVIRKTGGKTVLHHRELTYSFISQDVFLSIMECYQKISLALQAAFASFGVDTQMNKKEKIHAKGLNCFQELSSYEIEVGGKKLVGSAQKRSKNVVLQHGSILLDIDFALWSLLWRVEEQDLRSRITSLQELRGYTSASSLVCAIISKFAQEFQTQVYIQDFNKTEKTAINKISNSYVWNDFELEKIKVNERKKYSTKSTRSIYPI